MSDDRDRRRFADALHPAVASSGECDSGDSWGEGPTPVGKPSRRKPSMEVDASAFDPDVRWAEFREMQDEVRQCAKDRAKSARWRKWLLGALIPSGGGLVTLLVWAITKLDARADAAAQERYRIHMLQRHEDEIRALQLQSAAHAALLGVRAVLFPNP